MNDFIVIDTPAGINFAHLLALRSALRLQNVGLKKRGQSALTIYKHHYNPRVRTCSEAITDIQRLIDEAKLQRAA